MTKLLDTRLCFWLLASLVLAGCERAQAPPPPPGTPEVQVSYPVTRQVRDYEDFPGRMEAAARSRTERKPPANMVSYECVLEAKILHHRASRDDCFLDRLAGDEAAREARRPAHAVARCEVLEDAALREKMEERLRSVVEHAWCRCAPLR